MKRAVARMRVYGPLILLFGGVSLVLILSAVESMMSVRMPAEASTFTLTFDSITVRDRRLLTTDRFGTGFAALKLDGVKDYLMLDSAAGVVSSQFSFCFWLWIEQTGKEQVIFQKGEKCPDGDYFYKGGSYAVTLQKDARLSMMLVAPPGNYKDPYIRFVSDDTLKAREWMFIVISFDYMEQRFRYFLNTDPRSIEIQSSADTAFKAIHQTPSAFKVGASESYCLYVHSFEDFFAGAIDDIQVFNRPLKSEEMRVLYEPEGKLFIKYKIVILLLTVVFGFLVLLDNWRRKVRPIEAE